jgi:predicted MFS family arabinose efflux permease
MRGEISPHRWLILGVATYSFIALMINFSVFPVVSDNMAKDIGLNYAQIGLIMSVFSIFYGVVQIPAGVASDRFGGGRIASTSMLILGLSGLLLAYTPNYQLALAARVLMGLSGGLLLPSTMRLLPSWFNADEYDKAMGVYGSGQGIALFVTLISIPSVVSLYGWRFSLGLVSALTLLAAALSFLHLRERGEVEGLPKASTMRLSDLKRVFTGKLLLLTSFNVTSLAMFTGILTWMPLFLLKERGFPLIQVGYITAIMGVMMLVASYVGGGLSGKIGGGKVILTSMMLCVATPLFLAYSHSTLEVFAASMLAGWAISLYFGPTFGSIPTAVKNEYVGMGFGVFNTLSFIGSSITAAVTGLILEATQSFNLVFLTISAISILGLAGALALILAERG